ncbi:hypothetical protein OV203_16190 [Nannocystis sp. ILAH1]|uniref:hypothetical protein n=1 Tax=unclassified Nannocystis TaxID=2627009 RepID=UPI00226D6E6B|nr:MULTISPECIES: hypothetical protein [unclassified Nannocystis]MCY0988675.1 hypothetical protein [Nannocystis sp. ILAH1]MCY1072452.1 hypothetical protein [Nannocystis sp. RBIL2]
MKRSDPGIGTSPVVVSSLVVEPVVDVVVVALVVGSVGLTGPVVVPLSVWVPLPAVVEVLVDAAVAPSLVVGGRAPPVVVAPVIIAVSLAPVDLSSPQPASNPKTAIRIGPREIQGDDG